MWIEGVSRRQRGFLHLSAAAQRSSMYIVLLGAILAKAAVLSAQTFVVSIKQPSSWDFGARAVLTVGQPLIIHGTATHRAGILKVLINGQPASLTKDPQNPTYWFFDKTIPSDSVTADVSILFISMNGDSLRKPYRTNSTVVVAQTPPPKPKPAAEPVKPTVDPNPRPEIRKASPDLWRPFHHRAIGYGVAAGAGTLLIVLSKSDNNCDATPSTINCANDGGSSGAKTFGVGLVAASVVALGVDAFLTSRRDKEAKQSVALKTSSSNAFQLAAPAIVDLHHRIGLGVLRLSLR